MSNITIYIIASIVVSYLLGSISSAVWIGKAFYGVDIREHGSKNAGATNMLRVLGAKAALPVFIIDFLKGYAAVILITLLRHKFPEISAEHIVNIQIANVFAAMLGHILPIFAGFKGGKGVATLVGAITAIQPLIVLCAFGVWLIVMVLTRYVSLASMIAGCAFPIFSIILPQSKEHISFIIFSIFTALLLIWTQRKNIGRLRSGTESKTYFRRSEQK